MSDNATESPIAFHFSLNVSDLGRSIEFYRVLFGVEPAKRHDDYAKFELVDPPVVFSLSPQAHRSGGSLSHLGFRVSSKQEVERTADRLAAAGICTQDQNGTVCGYAKQDKVWTKDPDGNFWEVYVVEEDVEPHVVRSSLEGSAARLHVVTPKVADTAGCCPSAAADSAPSDNTSGTVVWEHYITTPLEDQVPNVDASVDEVRLTGTFNASLDDAARKAVVREAFRVLKPGGKIVTHGLMGDRPLTGAPPKLPGLAAMVSRVPARDEALALLAQAGFIGLHITKLTDKPWFVHDGIGLREVKIVAYKPTADGEGERRRVLYKGPLAEVKADGGWNFQRGQRVALPLAAWNQLRLGPSADQFVFFDASESTSCSSTKAGAVGGNQSCGCGAA
jgi:catechol 2,3-dioxygenase-like lactoylglutathione lyase family enzyme